jgi:hypothetical protein
VIWALPFLWIVVGMSVRRALDAGISPWHGLWVLVPFVNLLAMLILAALPGAAQAATYWNANAQRREPRHLDDVAATLKAVVGAIAVGVLYASVLVQTSVLLFDSYGATLFYGTSLRHIKRLAEDHSAVATDATSATEPVSMKLFGDDTLASIHPSRNQP